MFANRRQPTSQYASYDENKIRQWNLHEYTEWNALIVQ